MITVKELKRITLEEVSLQLFCTALSELDGMSMADIGLSADLKIQPGSFAYDSNASVAIYDGESWNEVE